jgi:hypothetical protein
MTTMPVSWADLRGSLPEHQDEIMTAHEGQPTAEVQDRTHGAGKPAVDRGLDDKEKLK